MSTTLVALSWLAAAIGVAFYAGTLFHRCDQQPTPPARPSAAHPSGRLMGCPDAITVDNGGHLQEVWL